MPAAPLAPRAAPAPLVFEPRLFPRPACAAAITTFGALGPETLGREGLYSMLLDASAEEWSHHVDSSSPTLLLLSRGWVFKTRRSAADGDPVRLQKSVDRWNRRMQQIAVWHPAKTWFMLRANHLYWPCNATPRMTLVRDLMRGSRDVVAVSRAKARLLRLRKYVFQCATYLRHGVLLDTGTGNYGFDSERRLYYVDDEIYHWVWRKPLWPEFTLLP